MKMQKHRNIIKKRGECCPDMTLKTILQAFGVSKISGRFEVVLVTRDQSRGERAEKKNKNWLRGASVSREGCK